MDRQNESSTEVFDDTLAAPESATQEPLITSGRIVNVSIALLCLAVMISSIVCLGVMESKHKAIINHIDPQNTGKDDEEVCILYTTLQEPLPAKNGTGTTHPLKYNRSHTCQFVIAVSGMIAALVLIAIAYYITRIFIMRR